MLLRCASRMSRLRGRILQRDVFTVCSVACFEKVLFATRLTAAGWLGTSMWDVDCSAGSGVSGAVNGDDAGRC